MSWSKLKAQAGSAGILAIVILAFLSVIGAGMVSRTSTEANMASSYRNGAAAQYLAESGAWEAIARLKFDAVFIADTNNTTIRWTSGQMNSGATAGTYTVTVTGAGNERAVFSIGFVGRARRAVYLSVTVTPGVYSSAIFCGPDFEAEQNTRITGSMGTNGNASFEQNSVVSGLVSAHGTVSTKQNSSVPNKEHVPLVNIPVLEIPWSNYSALPPPSWPLGGGEYYVNGSLELDKDTSYIGNGTIYVNGSIIIGQNVKLIGDITLVAHNNINIEQNMSITGDITLQAKGNISIGQNFGRNSNDATSVLIAAEGNIDIDQNFGKGSENNQAVLFANGRVKLEQGAKVKGFVMAGEGVKLRQNAIIVYDDALLNRPELPSDPSSIVTVGSWSSYKPTK